MLKRALIIGLILILAAIATATIYVIVVDPVPGWVDPNLAGQNVAAYEIMLGRTVTGGAREKQAGVVTQYNVLSAPTDMTWDMNEPNAISYTWTPTEVGVFYAQLEAMPVEPYEGYKETWTVAIWVRPALSPVLEWWYELVK